jgi:hypothetical protein
MSAILKRAALTPGEYEDWLQCHACLAQFAVVGQLGEHRTFQCPECGEEVPVPFATSPLTPAHHDLIRLLAQQAAQAWRHEQKPQTTEPQKQEGAGKRLQPSPAPSTPDL